MPEQNCTGVGGCRVVVVTSKRNISNNRRACRGYADAEQRSESRNQSPSVGTSKAP
jgi:hypothetical protein